MEKGLKWHTTIAMKAKFYTFSLQYRLSVQVIKYKIKW